MPSLREASRRLPGLPKFAGALLLLIPAIAITAHADEPEGRRLFEERAKADRTIWADEILAQQHEAVFIELWDQLRASEQKHKVLADFAFEQIKVGSAGTTEKLPNGVTRFGIEKDSETLTHEQWGKRVEAWHQQGWRLVQSEWHHGEFYRRDAAGHTSVFNIVLHLTGPRGARCQLAGPLRVIWAPAGDNARPIPARIARIDTTGLIALRRDGAPLFKRIELRRVKQLRGQATMLAVDLNGDGRSDPAFPALNKVLWNRGNRNFQSQDLCKQPFPVTHHAVFADFTGDGRLDYLVAAGDKLGDEVTPLFELFMFEQDDSGSYSRAPRRVAPPDTVKLVRPSAFAVGDIDGDRDLDLYVVQYKVPYIGGQFPAPYFDANDGYPAFLLRNDGNGRFTDVTEAAGLSVKRHRRSYRASMVDLDGDGDLDLLVVNDFAGIDIFRNDGRGQFSEATKNMVDVATNFGMGHALADFDADGDLDFYVAGMASTTARRLDQMGLREGPSDKFADMRATIAYGNRMYLNDGGGRFREPPYRDQVARSGWSWGCVAADFDNNGLPDLYVANGHLSGGSALDYCTRFWCHDIYSPGTADAARNMMFGLARKTVWLTGMSWNGFEHNHLFMNDGDGGYRNLAFLFGAAIEDDCRAVIADDLDRDGNVDLLVHALVREGRLTKGRRFDVLWNRGVSKHHWIGVTLRGATGAPVLGAMVTMTAGDLKQTAAVATGDSFLAQHSHTKHFGLGPRDRVDAITVRWADGTVSTIENPAIDRYHTIDRKRK
jgi:hypothetical protein